VKVVAYNAKARAKDSPESCLICDKTLTAKTGGVVAITLGFSLTYCMTCVRALHAALPEKMP
jgi:hypothetical protein